MALFSREQRCPVCNELKGIFAHLNRERIANKAMRELMEGCSKHPSYRFKNPTRNKKCDCQRLYVMYQELIALEEAERLATTANLKAERIKREEQRLRDEEYANSHQ